MVGSVNGDEPSGDEAQPVDIEATSEDDPDLALTEWAQPPTALCAVPRNNTATDLVERHPQPKKGIWILCRQCLFGAGSGWVRMSLGLRQGVASRTGLGAACAGGSRQEERAVLCNFFS